MTATPLRRRQRGLMALLLIASILTVVAAALVMRQAEFIHHKSGMTPATKIKLDAIRKSLVNFVTTHGRLPCPADGAVATGNAAAGVSVPAAPAAACTNANGTVPWTTLGLPADAVLDPWGRRISYRVYQGAAGMTTALGANMTDCRHPPNGSETPPSAPNFLCAPAHTTSEAGFLSARPGLTVNDGGVSQTGIAFVLISHGVTGDGAWLETGARMPLPAASVAETANAGAGATYYRQQYSDKGVPQTNPAFFDDEVLYVSIGDAIREARRGGRNWPAGGITGSLPITLNTPTISAACPTCPGGRNTGQATITIGGTPPVQVTASGGTISRNSGSGSATAIGVCPASGGCGTPQAPLQSGEAIIFKLLGGYTARKFGIQLSPVTAIVGRLTFRKGGAPVGAPIAITTASASGIDPGGDFDEVEVAAIGASEFYVDTIRFCGASSAC